MAEFAAMSLSIGSRIGPYEIVSLVNVGDPASVRVPKAVPELRRGLARADHRNRS